METNWAAVIAVGYLYLAGATLTHYVHAYDPDNPHHRSIACLLWFLAPVFIIGGMIEKAAQDDDDETGA